MKKPGFTLPSQSFLTPMNLSLILLMFVKISQTPQKESNFDNESDEILQSPPPIPQSHFIDATIRVAAKNLEDRGKNEASSESSGHQQNKKKKKYHKSTSEDRVKVDREEPIVVFDEEGHAKNEASRLIKKKRG